MTDDSPQKTSFFCKLVSPRPTFQADMSEAERAAMMEHVAYWTALTRKGIAVVFGPVADPAGSYGIAVVEAPDVGEVEAIRDDDPAIRAGIGLGYEIHPMRVGAIRK
jgi:uncharacterized protein YciI